MYLLAAIDLKSFDHGMIAGMRKMFEAFHKVTVESVYPE